MLTVAVAPDDYRSGLVLAGTEDTGIWRSTDGGHRFEPVRDAPQAINALAVGARSWLLSDALGLWRSVDGATWQPIVDSVPVLTLLATENGFLAGGEVGVTQIAGEKELKIWLHRPQVRRSSSLRSTLNLKRRLAVHNVVDKNHKKEWISC